MSTYYSNYNHTLKKNNDLCLKIIKIIDRNINLQKKYEDPFNLLKIFYQELIAYSTNIILIKNSPFNYNDKLNFPYLNSKYILKPKKLSFKLENKRNMTNNLTFGFGKKKIFMSRNLHLKKEIFFNFISKKKIVLNYHSNVNIPDYKFQLESLKNILKKIMVFLDLKNHLFIYNFISFVEYLLGSEKEIDFHPKNSVLIIGSNTDIQNRICSAKFLQNKTNKVISINHSTYPFYVYNEPIRNVEYSFCTDYISYGSFDFSKKIKSKIFSIPKFHFVNNKEFNDQPRVNKIQNIKFDKNFNFLYVPNTLNGNIRYGPFRDLDDYIYYKFQKDLLDIFKNTKIKIHPKGKKFYFSEKKRVHENIKFEKIFTKYQVYIFDYFSTAFGKAIATNKPIIYFDIGLRNLEKNILDIIKKRVYYCKINLNKDFKIQFKKFLLDISYEKNNKINLFTKKFTINKKHKSVSYLLERII